MKRISKTEKTMKFFRSLNELYNHILLMTSNRTKGRTTIQIGVQTRDELKQFGIKDETYERIILNLMKFKKEHDGHNNE